MITANGGTTVHYSAAARSAKWTPMCATDAFVHRMHDVVHLKGVRASRRDSVHDAVTYEGLRTMMMMMMMMMMMLMFDVRVWRGAWGRRRQMMMSQ